MARRAASFVLFLASIGCAAAIGAAPAGAAPAGGDLYLLQASGGSLHGSQLVLRGVDPTVTSFTDRPQRSASSLPANRFLGGWGRLFGDDPPNAALEVKGAPAGRDVALLELRNPRYRRRTRTLTYRVRRLRKTGDAALASFGRRADGDAVARFGPSSLFIDNGGGEQTAVEFELEIPALSNLEVSFDEGSIELAPNGLTLLGLTTPAAGGASSFGEITLGASSFSILAAGPGGGLQAQVTVFVETPPDERITGKASVPPGAKVSLVAGAGATNRVPLTSGPFSYQLESG